VEYTAGETDLPFKKYGGTDITTGNKIECGRCREGKRKSWRRHIIIIILPPPPTPPPPLVPPPPSPLTFYPCTEKLRRHCRRPLPSLPLFQHAAPL